MDKKKIVYIACPYTMGDLDMNIHKALVMADRLEGFGYMVFLPILSHFRHITIPHDYEYWMERDLEWILRCDCVLRMPGKSDGADREIEFAMVHNIPIYFSIEELTHSTQ